jgi:prevent-host-death family protein
MLRVGIRELKEQTSQILRRVREEGDTVEVTYRGRLIARVVPVTEPGSHTSVSTFRREWKELGEAISASWPEGVSALDAVREDRQGL